MKLFNSKCCALTTLFLVLFTMAYARNFSDSIKPSDIFIEPSKVSVKGILGDAISRSEKGRMVSLPSWKDGQLIKMFSVASREKNNTTDWYGEHAGKWMLSTALAVNRSGDENLESLLIQNADYLISTQEADGYLGSYSPALRITNQNSKFHQRSWDVWSLSYMMLGFLEVHQLLQSTDSKYLAAAKKIGELLLNTFGKGGADITDYGTRYGYSATIALEPIVELYKTTRDKRYLDLALSIVKKVEQKEGLRFIKSALNNKDMETVADGKAYQIIWNMVGLAKLYEVTGTTDYLIAVENAWQNIKDYHLTITGGPWGGIGKHKECFNAKNYWSPYGFVETCSIMSWIQLNKQLLHLTGDPKYAQEIETSSYNALLGAQFPNGQDWTYHSFTNGKKHTANYNDCCPSSGMLALEELTSIAYSKRNNGIAVNLFGQNQASIPFNDSYVQLVQKTDYPFSGTIQLSVSSLKKIKFPLMIRIPAWAEGATIKVDGKPVSGVTAGTYFTVDRLWDKETEVEIDFPITSNWITHSEYATEPQGTEDIYRVNWIALQRGPLIYATNGLINGEDRERVIPGSPKVLKSKMKPLASPSMNQAFVLNLDGMKPLEFQPFYIAGGREDATWRLTWIQNKIN